MLNFNIEEGRSISNLFLKINIPDFDAACGYIANLPFRSNSNNSNLILVLEERCGTAATKHAILRKLAIENGHTEVLLKMTLFKMNANFHPQIKETLKKHQLAYIPAIHHCLVYQNEHLDYTRIGSSYADIKDYIIDENTIEYFQIDEYEKSYLLSYYVHWIQTENIPYSPTELWNIMETCFRLMQD